MTMKLHNAKKPFTAEDFYTAFDKIDGQHPWMTAVTEGFVAYNVRQLEQGQVAYFNFILAKEMGLINPDHPEVLNTELEAKLIETFSLQIINEYDELSKRRIHPNTIRPQKYMATRYLQLQHSNKQGKTSGDGRGIWNGIVRHNGTTWDISSRGTGVTCLSPGAVEAKKPLKTGGTQFGYGCGLAEMDELLGASISAEIMHLQGINTERVLCIIDLGKGYGIGVRAAKNLIRPAHLFLYLKQAKYESLKAATNYLIERQVDNKAWNINLSSLARYDQMLDIICDSFARFSANLDVDYIFAWLDWDGDNVLADAGIIDYGSIRQFGIRHDKYRYDDVQRFSTNLNEQRKKARLTVQVFIQLTDYLKTKKKKPLRNFSKHSTLKKFDQLFNQHRAQRLLYRMGFDQNQRQVILKNKKLFQTFDKDFLFFERAKVSGSEEKVADGINHAALFNMRKVFKEYSRFLMESDDEFEARYIPEKNFYRMMLSGFAKTSDQQMNEQQKNRIKSFQNSYKELIRIAAGKCKPDDVLIDICHRAEILNSDKRITGNALIEIVDEIINQKQKHLNYQQIQSIIDRLIMTNHGSPEVNISQYFKKKDLQNQVKQDLLVKVMNLVEQNCESI